jgi:hypothetical protein
MQGSAAVRGSTDVVRIPLAADLRIGVENRDYH